VVIWVHPAPSGSDSILNNDFILWTTSSVFAFVCKDRGQYLLGLLGGPELAPLAFLITARLVPTLFFLTGP
jgi:hypothetical protein